MIVQIDRVIIDGKRIAGVWPKNSAALENKAANKPSACSSARISIEWLWFSEARWRQISMPIGYRRSGSPDLGTETDSLGVRPLADDNS
jgi:hypothetical protein